jgi:hypothetical protein
MAGFYACVGSDIHLFHRELRRQSPLIKGEKDWQSSVFFDAVNQKAHLEQVDLFCNYKIFTPIRIESLPVPKISLGIFC